MRVPRLAGCANPAATSVRPHPTNTRPPALTAALRNARRFGTIASSFASSAATSPAGSQRQVVRDSTVNLPSFTELERALLAVMV
jgi:hypothetical protein